MISEIVTLAVVVGVATGTDAAVKTGAATVEGTGATLAGLVRVKRGSSGLELRTVEMAVVTAWQCNTTNGHYDTSRYQITNAVL